MAEIIVFERMLVKAIERSEKALSNGDYDKAWEFFGRVKNLYENKQFSPP